MKLLPVGHPDRDEIPVLISSTRRAMAGWIDLRNFDAATRTVWHVRGLRNARAWDTTQGTAELARKGPGPNARLDVASDCIVMGDVVFIRPLTDDAVKAWGI